MVDRMSQSDRVGLWSPPDRGNQDDIGRSGTRRKGPLWVICHHVASINNLVRHLLSRWRGMQCKHFCRKQWACVHIGKGVNMWINSPVNLETVDTMLACTEVCVLTWPGDYSKLDIHFSIYYIEVRIHTKFYQGTGRLITLHCTLEIQTSTLW